MMKISINPFLCLLCVLLLGCNNDNDGELYLPDYYSSHARMMGFKGRVKQVKVYCPEEDLMLLSADFDVSGHCLTWNDTGVDPFPDILRSRGITSGWMSTPSRYTYTYNEQGKLVAVDQYVLGGELEHYAITYGHHALSLPLPVPMGPFSQYFVSGISSIKSANFSLQCDGTSATAERKTLAWMSLRESAEYVFQDGRVTEKIERLYGSRDGSETQQIERVRTFYEYEGTRLSRTLEVGVDAEDYQEKVDIYYSQQHGLLPVRKSFYSGMAAQLLSEMTYTYDVDGLILSVDNTVGEPYFEMPYSQEYLTFDDFGNWKTAVRHSEGVVIHLQQDISYW